MPIRLNLVSLPLIYHPKVEYTGFTAGNERILGEGWWFIALRDRSGLAGQQFLIQVNHSTLGWVTAHTINIVANATRLLEFPFISDGINLRFQATNALMDLIGFQVN